LIASAAFVECRSNLVLLLPTLPLDQPLELALHRLERVVDYFAQRLVHFVRRRLLVRNKLVAGWDGDIDSHPKRIARVLRAIRVLDHDIAPADVIAKAIEARGFVADEFVELVRFLDTPI
jgi:hypothetical protein